MNIHTGKDLSKPYKLMIYGNPGVGKSTLANTATKPVFIDIEGGLSRIDCNRTPMVKSISDLSNAVTYLLTQKDVYSTVIIDTADQLDILIQDEICRKAGKESLSEFGFGSGFEMLNRVWIKILSGLEKLVDNGFNLIILAHQQTKTFNDPTLEPYDRISMKLHTKPAGMLFGKMDAVWYYAWETIVSGKSNEKKKAISTGCRILHTKTRAAYEAKDRYDMPDKLEVNDRFNLSIFEEKIRS